MPSTPELAVNFRKDSAMRDALRKPFPPEHILKLPASENRPALDYVSHAAVTDRLNRAAPGWTYTVDEVLTATIEKTKRNGETYTETVCWIRGTMTIGEVSRVEYGDGQDPKKAISDFIKRGAMRFGVALDLWAKEELQASGGSTATPSPENQRTSVPTVPDPTSGDAPPDAPRRGDIDVVVASSVEEVGARPGKAAPASEAVPLEGLATDAQWAKARTLELTKAAVLKAVQGQGFTEIRKASDVPAAAMAELLHSYGVALDFR